MGHEPWGHKGHWGRTERVDGPLFVGPFSLGGMGGGRHGTMGAMSAIGAMSHGAMGMATVVRAEPCERWTSRLGAGGGGGKGTGGGADNNASSLTPPPLQLGSADKVLAFRPLSSRYWAP